MPPKQSREKSQDPTRDKCARCKRVKHIDDVEEQGEPKQSMSKKKSHKNKTVNDKICCHHCKAWYHYRCSGLEQWQYEIYEKWHCEKCAETAGPSVEHKKVAINRYHWWSLDEAKNENVEVGSEAWINSHKTSEHKIQAASDKEVIVVKNGTEFYKKLDETKHEWKKVVLIQNKAGLGIKVPEKDTFDVEKIVEIMGPNHEVDTIAVYRQRPYAMKLESFLKLYRAPIPRKELYNFLSCEFSEFEEMRSILTPPRFVLEQSFVDLLYPRHGSKEYKALVKNGEALSEDERPKVEEYLLAGMAGSYTDFHIDFGGSSVYYHVIYGKKVFYLVEPTEENLKAFEKHETNSKTHDWFGTKCQSSLRRLVVTEGQTLIMPAGWIHAVYTPEDSLVFGGNFLHLACVPMQMRIYRLENAMKAVVNGDDKYYFPNFELLHWMLLRNLIIEKLREYNDEGEKIDLVFLTAAISCLNTMKEWFKKDQRKIRERGASSAEEEDSLKSDLENKEILLKELEKQIKKQNTIRKEAGDSAPTTRKMAANAKKRTTSTSNKRDASRGRNAPKRKKGQNEDEEDEEDEEIEEEEAPQEPRVEKAIVAPHKCFLQSKRNIENGFKVGTLLALPDREVPAKLVFGKIEEKEKLWIKVSYPGSDAENDWYICNDPNLRPITLTHSVRDNHFNKIAICSQSTMSPDEMEHFKQTNLKKNLAAADAFNPITLDADRKNMFKKGHLLEAIDLKHFSKCVFSATVVDADKIMVSIKFDNAPIDQVMKVHYDSLDIFPCGWADLQGVEIGEFQVDDHPIHLNGNNQDEVVDEDDARPVAPVSPLHAPVASGTMTGQGPSGVNNHLQSTGLTQVANPTTTSGNTVGGKRGRQVAAPINTDAPSTSSQSIVNGRGQEHEVLEDVEIKPNIENLSAVSQAEKNRRLAEFDGTMNWKWNTHQLCEKVEEIGRLEDYSALHIHQMVRLLHEQKFTGHVLKLSSEEEIQALYVELKTNFGVRKMLTSILKRLGWPALPAKTNS